jgi:hypothetical protein
MLAFALAACLQTTPVHAAQARYDTKLWMRDLMEGAAYLPK